VKHKKQRMELFRKKRLIHSVIVAKKGGL